MKAAQSRQKSYAVKRQRRLEFLVGDQVFLQVSPTKGVMQFKQLGKLALRCSGPYPHYWAGRKGSISVVAPEKLSRVHNVFHVSQLHKYIPDPTHVIELDPLQAKEGLTCEELPIEFRDHR